MSTFLVTMRRSGPAWDDSLRSEEQSEWEPHADYMDQLVERGFVVLGGPLSDEHRVVLVVEAESEDGVYEALARDPGGGAHRAGGQRAGSHGVGLVVEAESEDVVYGALARDPWSESHLRVDAVERWTVRLD